VQTIEAFFCFLRGSEFTFPNILLLLQDVLIDIGGHEMATFVDYTYFARELQNWFVPGSLRGLDEYGVPLPLIQKYQSDLPVYDVDLAVTQLQRMVGDGRIQGVEARILRGALDIQPPLSSLDT
jgi:hypothetical protein